MVALLLGLPLDLDDWGGGGVARLPRETAQTARKRGRKFLYLTVNTHHLY